MVPIPIAFRAAGPTPEANRLGSPPPPPPLLAGLGGDEEGKTGRAVTCDLGYVVEAM
jgi:hypothetical protein